ncbi:MAG: PTS sugar transporter subunit IIC [Coprobacillaceae bacterium]
MEKLEKLVLPFANTLNKNKVIQGISQGIMLLMPALMIGALASLIQQIPFEAYQDFIVSTGIYKMMQVAVNVTTNMLALYASFAIAYKVVSNEGYDGIMGGLLSLISFMIVTPIETVGEGYTAVSSLSLTWLGSMGLFTAMIISILVAYLYMFIVKRNWTIKMPDSVPTFVSNSFAGIVPGAIIGIVVLSLSAIASMTDFGDVHSLIYGVIGTPLSNLGGSIWTALLVYLLSGLCWFFGIHGIAVMSTVLPIWMAADYANIAMISAGGTAENLVTYNWVNVAGGNLGGAGATIGLILLCTFASKSKRYKEMGKLAIVPSCFGINEPVVFGLPCMLNATLAIPFVFLPVVLIGISYLLTTVGILPVGNGLGSPVQIPIVAGMFNGGIVMAIWQAVQIVISIIVYLPFFKILDKQALDAEKGEVDN